MPTAEKPAVLVTGARGMLGSMLLKIPAAGLRVLGTDLPECDITDSESVLGKLDGLRPDWVVNCAAFTDVDGCEAEPGRAAAVNGEGAGNLARACRERGVSLIQISTDFVFDGRGRAPYPESAAPNPANEYGRSKLLGEQAVAAAGGRYAIVRTSWLFGPGGRNFPRTILLAARSRPNLKVVSDQTGSPTYTLDLARGLLALIENRAEGIFHFAGAGSCSWHEFAVFLLATAGLQTPVLPIGSAEAGRRARRPSYSVLDCSRYTRVTGNPIRSWREMAADYLATGDWRLTEQESGKAVIRNQ